MTTAGVLGIAYDLAKEYNFITAGVAPKRAKGYELFPVDEIYIVGERFGDESDYFLNSVTRLIRIGGGMQSLREVKLAKNLTHITSIVEYDVATTHGQ